MEDDPVLAGTLYVVGHVRLYHGKQTELPKRYVSRQRLCLRGTTDYWVNDALGKPFFRVDRPIDQGMLEALRSDIVPQLLRDVPRQPSPEELQANPHRCRFVLIFDREGYSPVFIKEMWQTHRIACITYHKFPKEAWPVGEFAETQAEVDSQIQSVQSKLNRKPVEFAAHTIRPEMDQAALPKWEDRKRALREAIEPLEQELARLKQKRPETPHHLKWEDFPLADKFERLSPSRKRLMDTIKMVAYRAETAMVEIVREVLAREDDARSLIRDLMQTEADLSPDLAAGTLTIRVHSMANPGCNRAIQHLLSELNNTESKYPGTTLKLVYHLVGMAPTP